MILRRYPRSCAFCTTIAMLIVLHLLAALIFGTAAL